MVETINGRGELYRNAFRYGTGRNPVDFRDIVFTHDQTGLAQEAEALRVLGTEPTHSPFDAKSTLFYNVTNPSRRPLDVLWVPIACPLLPLEGQNKDKPPVEGRTYIVKAYSPVLPKPVRILVFADDMGVAERQVKSQRSREMNGLGSYSRDVDAYPRLVTTDEFIAEARRQMEAGEFVPNFIINEFPELIELRKELYRISRDSQKPKK